MDTGTGTRQGDTRLVLGGLAAFVPFVLLTGLVVGGWGPLLRLDERVSTGFTTGLLPHPRLVDGLQWATDLLGPWPFRGVVLVAALVLLTRDAPGSRSLAVWTVVVTWGGGLLGAVTKVLVGRDRPEVADPLSSAPGASYPSGHALGATVGCAVLLALAWPRLRPAGRVVALGAAVTLAGFVSFTRVALGVHYLSDVVGGVLLGLAWLALVTLLLHPPRPHPRRPGRPGRTDP